MSSYGGRIDSCREYMICPLPRASEVSALRAARRMSISNQGGADATFNATFGRPPAEWENISPRPRTIP